MKVFLIIFANLVFLTSFSSAQNLTPEQMGARVPLSVPAKVQKQYSVDRTTISFSTDYAYLDEQFHGATNAFGWTMGDSGVIRYTCVLLDTLVDNQSLQGYDFANIGTYTIDSVHITTGHTNSSGQNNNFIFRLVDLGGNNYPNLNDADLWVDTVTTNTSLFGQSSWLQFGTIDLAVGVTLNNTDRTGLFFEFEGQSGDTAGILAYWLPDGPCTSADRTRWSFFSWPHSYYFYQASINTWLPTPSGGDLYWDCNSNQTYEQGIDSESYIQDVDIWFDLTFTCGPTNCNFTTVDATCGQADGSATANVTGGVTPYTFQWGANAGNQTTQAASNLAFGSYTVTVTDSVGCTEEFTVIINNPNAPSGSSTSINPSCANDCNGSVDLSVTGGSSPYTFLWSNAATTEDISGLCAGNYRVTISDNNGCLSIWMDTITDPPLLVLTSSTVDDQGSCNGSATVTPTGGTTPYSYQWDANAGNQATQTASGLCAGFYCVTVTDYNSCTAISCDSVDLFIGVREHEPGNRIRLIPNPTTGFATITNTEQGIMSVEVFDIFGQSVPVYFDIGRSLLDIRHSPSGIYFVRIGESVHKLVLSR